MHTPWESKKINAAHRHIFPNGAGSHTEAGRAQLVEQLFLYEVHLPQIWRVWIQGSSMGSNHFRLDMPRLVEFYMRGKLHLEDWISAKLKLSEINDGFANMKAGKTLFPGLAAGRFGSRGMWPPASLIIEAPRELVIPRRIRIRWFQGSIGTLATVPQQPRQRCGTEWQ